MDLKAVLNDENKDDNRLTSSQTKRPPPPPLSTPRSTTSIYTPTSTYNAHESPQRYSNPPIAQSPGSLPPPSAHSYTSTPHSSIPPASYQSPYQRSAPLPSPGPRTGSLSNSYFAPGQPPSSHHHFHRSSTSPLDQGTPYHESPPLSRAIPPSSATYSHPHFQPHTPLGPPPIFRHDSTHSTHTHHDSPTPSYQRHRSSSGASHRSPPAAPGPPLPPPKTYIQQSDGLARRESHQSLTTSQRVREESLSVSPKTILQSLPRQNTTYAESASTSIPPSSAHLQRLHEKPTADRTHSISEDAKPKPEHLTHDHSDNMFTIEAKHLQGIKRSADNLPASEVSLPSKKKLRTMKAPPLWAQPKRGLRPLKVNNHLKPNGNTQRANTPLRRSPNAQPQSTFTGPVAGNSLENVEYDRSIRDIVPNEDLTRQIIGFIHQKVINEDPTLSLPFEIEAKVGRLTDRSRGEEGRLSLPVMSETIINTAIHNVSFESRMTEHYHKMMNDYLNQSVLLSKQQPESGKRARIPMEYKHSREVDAFYELPHSELERMPAAIRERFQFSKRRPRIRITRDKQKGDVIAKVIKASVGDVNVFCPNSKYDWRVSVNIEYQWDGSVDALEEHAANAGGSRGPNRNKDRLSYKHQFCQVDLTQVKIGQAPGGSYEDISHELEVEFDVNVLRREAKLAMSHQNSKYYEYMKVFVDNVRTLARYES